MPERLIIYDLDGYDKDIFSDLGDNNILFSASPAVKYCIGCFGCWLKTPGKCVIEDRCGVIPSSMSRCDEVILVSPVLYGGYSHAVKAVIDRSIGYMLPYFRYVGGEMHHQMRYLKPFKLSVYFYGECGREEAHIAERLVKANAVNFGVNDYSVLFYDSIVSVREAIA